MLDLLLKKNQFKFEQAAKKTDTYQRHLLEYARDGGFITAEAFTAMTEANKNYVTFARELIQDGKPVVAEGSGVLQTGPVLLESDPY